MTNVCAIINLVSVLKYPFIMRTVVQTRSYNKSSCIEGYCEYVKPNFKLHLQGEIIVKHELKIDSEHQINW